MQKAIGKRKTDVRYSKRIERGEKSGENVFSHSQLTIHKTCTLYNITHKSAVDTIYNKKNPSLIKLELQIVTLKEKDKSFAATPIVFFQCFCLCRFFHSLIKCSGVYFSSSGRCENAYFFSLVIIICMMLWHRWHCFEHNFGNGVEEFKITLNAQTIRDFYFNTVD